MQHRKIVLPQRRNNHMNKSYLTNKGGPRRRLRTSWGGANGWGTRKKKARSAGLNGPEETWAYGWGWKVRNSRDDIWGMAGSDDIQVDSHSAPKRVLGEKRVQEREVKWRRTVTDGGAVGYRSGGGEQNIQNMVVTGGVGRLYNKV